MSILNSPCYLLISQINIFWTTFWRGPQGSLQVAPAAASVMFWQLIYQKNMFK